MKRVYPNQQITFNVSLNKFPFYDEQDILQKLNFKFYTKNPEIFISKNRADIHGNKLVLTGDELSILEEGILRYDYETEAGSKYDITSDYYLVLPYRWGLLKGQIENQRDLVDYIQKKIEEEVDKRMGIIDIH